MESADVLRRMLILKVVKNVVAATPGKVPDAVEVQEHLNEHYATFGMANITDDEFTFISSIIDALNG